MAVEAFLALLEKQQAGQRPMAQLIPAPPRAANDPRAAS
jgi:hypothetical protein